MGCDGKIAAEGTAHRDMEQGTQAETMRLAGNQQLSLDDATAVWIVRSGSVVLFSVRPHGDALSGPRRPLTTVAEGGALFGSARRDGGPSLSAVALSETELVRESRESFNTCAEADLRKLHLVDGWIHALSAAIKDAGTPTSEQNLSCRLDTFHSQFRLALATLEREEVESCRRRIVARETNRARSAGGAFAALAGTAQSETGTQGLPEGPPLLAAFAAAARSMGVSVVEPAKGRQDLDAGQYARSLAASSHFRIRSVVLPQEWWRTDAGPLVGFRREDQRPVALVPAGPGRYRLFDPIPSTWACVDRGEAASLDPHAYMLYRPFKDRVVGVWDLLRFGLQGHAHTVRTIVLAALFATLLGMLTPVAFGILIDAVIPDGNRMLLFQLAIALAAATAGRALLDVVQGYAVVRLESSASHNTQAAVWDRLLGMRPGFFRNYDTGDLVSRALAVSSIHRQLSGATLGALIGGTASFLNLLLLFYYSSRLAVLGVCAGAASSAVTLVCGLLTLRLLKPLQSIEGSIFGLSVQLIQGVSKLRVSAAESAAFSRWASRFVEQQRLKQSLQRIQDALAVFDEFLPTLATTLLFWLAAGEILGPDRGPLHLTTGTFLAFNAAFGVFLGGAASLSGTAIDALQNVALFERARPILQGDPEVDARKADPGTLRGKLAVDRVGFRYRHTGPLTLDNVSLRAEPGEFVAIVGPSGSGKSTLLRLLLGFESPESGAVYYDGQNLAGTNVNAVRRQIGVVMQSSNIMAGTVLENIAAGAALTLDNAWAAARDAGLEEDLNALPMGMHTVISEGGTNLSGGQRQRLLIARALACRPRVIYFDEATSALDNRTQAIVSRSLERLHVTRVVIAHRLSTIQNADRIYVIESGRVVQEGTFSSLAGQQDGLFARMMARQML